MHMSDTRTHVRTHTLTTSMTAHQMLSFAPQGSEGTQHYITTLQEGRKTLLYLPKLFILSQRILKTTNRGVQT